MGALFPSFELTAAGSGDVLTRSSLKGKPSIVWFTTSYCVPCQIGASRVAPVDDELGGKAFNVLVVFVDPREPASALINWRQFGRSDWRVALDRGNDLATKVGLRVLDTKFLLDRRGVIENVDFAVADNAYLGKVRKTVREAGL